MAINSAVETALVSAIQRLAETLKNKTAPNSLKLENQTLVDVVAAILQGTATNASKLDGMTYAELVTSLGGDGTTAGAVQAAIDAQIDRTDNPHAVTAEQVGLGSVQNYGIATEAEALLGADDQKYMTPALVKQVIDAAVDALVNDSPENLNQLNELAAALGDDPNLSTTLMTQIGTLETPAGAQAKVDAFAARRDNPHQVTAAQVGLGNVQNFGVASEAEALDGTSDAKYLTPALAQAAVDSKGFATQADVASFWSIVGEAFDDEADQLEGV